MIGLNSIDFVDREQPLARSYEFERHLEDCFVPFYRLFSSFINGVPFSTALFLFFLCHSVRLYLNEHLTDPNYNTRNG